MDRFIFWVLDNLANVIGNYKEKKRISKIKPVAKSFMDSESLLGCEYLLLEVEDENSRIPEA